MPERVVTKLTQSLHYKFHHVFFDSFFTSVRLVKTLLRHGIYACGTVNKNRKDLPSTFKQPPRLLQGQWIAKQDGNLVATVWQDKRPIAFLSTNANPLMVDVTTRMQKDGARRPVDRPEAATLYQEHFRGVDICDQLRSSYSFGRPSKKWWKYIMNYIFNTSIINAFLVMMCSEVNLPIEKKRYRQLTFRMRLAQQLIDGFSSSRRPVYRPTIHGTIHADSHALIRLNRKRSTCKTCVKELPKKRKDTVYGCRTCNVHLCSSVCSMKYHNEE